MNILILNASPRPKGTLSTHLESISRELSRKGHRVVKLDITRLHFAPCTGCMQCRTRNRCLLPADDTSVVLHHITEADAILIGSPCYWGNMPGTLKSLFDRMVYGLIETPRSPFRLPRGRLKGKRALLLITSTAPSPFHLLAHQARGTASALRHILRSAGLRPIRVCYRPGTTRSQVTPQELERYTARAVRFLTSGKRHFQKRAPGTGQEPNPMATA